jgi:RNA polymerase sigma-70 factor, ECF subfamily
MINKDIAVLAKSWNMLPKDNRADPKNEDMAAKRLVQRVAKNLDRAAFAELFDAFAPRVKTFIIRKGASPDLAEDLVQETMINVWTKAGFYDPAKGSVLTWIFTIARNLRIDRIRRESSRPVSELADFDPPSDAPAGEEILARKDEARSVARALGKIPPEQMEILTLSFIEDLPQAEIARRLNLPLGTVKSRMRLAYGHLRKTLEQPN